jgi:thimet oligopeptidase
MTEAIEAARPTIPIYDPSALSAAAEKALSDARRAFAAIESLGFEALTPESVLDAWDRISITLEDAYGPVSILSSVHPDAAVRDAGDRAEIEESVFMTELFQNEQLFERVRRVEPRTAAQRQLKKDLLEAFEDSGVALPRTARSLQSHLRAAHRAGAGVQQKHPREQDAAPFHARRMRRAAAVVSRSRCAR